MRKGSYLFIGHDTINDKMAVNVFSSLKVAENEKDDFEQHLMPAIIIPFSKTKRMIEKLQSIKQNR